MRPLLITERFPPKPGGMAVSAGRIVQGIRARDIAIDVLVIGARNVDVPIEIVDRDNGSDILVGPHLSPGETASFGLAHVKMRHLKRPYTTVLGFGCNYPGFVATAFAAHLGTSSVVLIRGNDLDRDFYEPKLGHYVQGALSRATRIGTVSPDKIDPVRRLFPGVRVHFTPNGIDPDQCTLLPVEQRQAAEIRRTLSDGRRRIVGCIGELKLKKRIPLLLAALRESGLGDRVALLLVGKLDSATQQILEDPILAPEFLHVPTVARDEIFAYLSACDFVALPSLADGMPNVLLEAMAMGRIPIVSNAGALPHVVKHGELGFVFEAENCLHLSEVLNEAIHLTQPKFDQMSSCIEAFIQKEFSLGKELDTILELCCKSELRPDRDE